MITRCFELDPAIFDSKLFLSCLLKRNFLRPTTALVVKIWNKNWVRMNIRLLSEDNRSQKAVKHRIHENVKYENKCVCSWYPF